MSMKSPSNQQYPRRFWLGVVVKGLALFLLCNLVYMATGPAHLLGRISVYNRLFPGRARLPYGDEPALSYNLSLFNLEAMFASHEIDTGAKDPAEFRVVLLGDSSTWGFLLSPEQTLAARINARQLRTADGRHVRAYNLGYPVMSLTKDLLLLSYAQRYQPDLVIWLFTLESFPADKQLFPPLLQHNPGALGELIATYGLDLDRNDPAFVRPTLWDRTLIGGRRELADLLRLQAYGVLWAATGIDQYIPETYTPLTVDFPADDSYYDFAPPDLTPDDLALESIAAAHAMLGGTPLLLVNEPMFISQGENSHIRYNFYFPRWAYDDYRRILQEQAVQHGWDYLDLWDLIPPEEFTNTAVHLSPGGVEMVADHIQEAILHHSE